MSRRAVVPRGTLGSRLGEQPELPHDEDAEREVLGTILADSGRAHEGFDQLSGHDFYLRGHEAIFAAVRAVMSRSEIPDVAAVAGQIERSRASREAVAGLDSCDPRAYLVNLAGREVYSSQAFAQRCANLRRFRALRDAIDAAREIEQAAHEPGAEPARVLERLNVAKEGLEAGAGILDRFGDAALSLDEFTVRNFPQRPSLLGDGVLRAGGLGILFGKPGLGKTWLALERALALVRGERWLGIPTKPGGARVGFLELELEADALQERLAALIRVHGGPRREDARLKIVCRPMLHGMVDLTSPDEFLQLKRWITRDRLELVEIDALSRAHTADERDAQQLGRVLAGFDAVRHDTGCALDLVHHERKGQNGRWTDDDLDALRGTSRLQSDPTLLVRVVAMHGLRSVRFPKASEGREPDPIWYQIDPDGLPVVVDAPKAKASGNRARVLEAVREAGESGIGRQGIENRTGLSRATVAKHLSALIDDTQVVSRGENRGTRYYTHANPPNLPNPDLLADESCDGAQD